MLWHFAFHVPAAVSFVPASLSSFELIRIIHRSDRISAGFPRRLYCTFSFDHFIIIVCSCYRVVQSVTASQCVDQSYVRVLYLLFPVGKTFVFSSIPFSPFSYFVSRYVCLTYFLYVINYISYKIVLPIISYTIHITQPKLL